MSTTKIFILVIAGIVLLLRIYQKYIKKQKDLSDSMGSKPDHKSVQGQSTDDEYEPYSGK